MVLHVYLVDPVYILYIYKTLVSYRNYHPRHTQTYMIPSVQISSQPPNLVLCSDCSWQHLAAEWVTNNKSRVYAIQVQHEAADAAVKHIAAVASEASPVPISSQPVQRAVKINEHVLASFRQVASSRLDLQPVDVTPTPIAALSIPARVLTESSVCENSVVVHTAVMTAIEKTLITRICDSFLHADPPYSRSRTVVSNSTRYYMKKAETHSTVNCLAQIETLNGDVNGVNGSSVNQLYLPMSPPTQQQLQKCSVDACYKKNVILNLAEIIGSVGNLQVSLHTGKVCDPGRSVHIDPNAPIKALGGISSCESLLFGGFRISSDPDFCVGSEMGKTYATAVHMYQGYSNVTIGPHITLMPVFGKRTPMVVSIRCPELDLSHTEVSASVVRSHPKFGPNHTTRIVEMMPHLASFAKRCSEAVLSLPPEIVSDVHKIDCMPTASVLSVDHSFSHNTEQGISAYVGTHDFSLPVGTLESGVPTIKPFRVYLAVLFGEVPTPSVG